VGIAVRQRGREKLVDQGVHFLQGQGLPAPDGAAAGEARGQPVEPGAAAAAGGAQIVQHVAEEPLGVGAPEAGDAAQQHGLMPEFLGVDSQVGQVFVELTPGVPLGRLQVQR